MYLGRLPVRWAKNSRGWGGGGLAEKMAEVGGAARSKETEV